MAKSWHFFMEHWLLIFWIWIIAAFVAMGIWTGIHEILFRIERRRYQGQPK